MADKYVKQDGRVFLFKPGQNGSLTDLKKRKPEPMDLGPGEPVAKIVPQINPPVEADEPSVMPKPPTSHGYSMNGQHVIVGSDRG